MEPGGLAHACRLLEKHVVIDGSDIAAVVTAVAVRPAADDGEYVTCEVSYFFAGDLKTIWVEAWRLREAPAP